MLQKIKYESIDYGTYEKLRAIFMEDNLEPKLILELDLQR
jgi:hypothetical protein